LLFSFSLHRLTVSFSITCGNSIEQGRYAYFRRMRNELQVASVIQLTTRHIFLRDICIETAQMVKSD
ncbi:MAG: hypothetical protein ACRD8Z_04710, partial [Nitrososphaeraceae archaeon]